MLYFIIKHYKGNNVHFSEYLKSCRDHSNITQEQLVHELYSYDIDNFEGLDTSTLSKWERSVTKPKISKQISIIKYFQEKTGLALPYLDTYSVKEAEALICTNGINNLIGTGKKKELILNFPSTIMHVDDMKVFPLRNSDRIEELLNINIDIHESTNSKYAHVSIEQFKEWSLHPSNLFLACEYKNWFMGLFFSIRLKPDVFDKILNFQMKKSDITMDDFASFDEMGCNYLLSFYAINQKVASMLFIRYYAHLISNQKNIVEIGLITSLNEVKKVIQNMNLHYHKNISTDDNVKIEAYRENLTNVLASENVIKMILSKQECPEE